MVSAREVALIRTEVPLPMPGELLSWLGGVPGQAIEIGAAMGLLLAAAWQDLRTRLIPDMICLTLAIFGIWFRLQVGFIDFAFSAILSLVLFFLLFAAFNRGVVGGGDVKLMVATGLWLSPPDCYVFLVGTALAGGVLALLHLGLRGLLRERWAGLPVAETVANSTDVGFSFARALRVESERIRSGGPLPYGIAIAIGGCYSLLISLGG